MMTREQVFSLIRAHLADDEDGPVDLLTGDVGILFPPIDDAQAIGQGSDEVAAGDFDADRREPRLVDEPVDQ